VMLVSVPAFTDPSRVSPRILTASLSLASVRPDALCMDTATERLGHFTRDQVQHGRSLDYVRWVSCLIESDGEVQRTRRRFSERWPRSISAEISQRRRSRLARHWMGRGADRWPRRSRCRMPFSNTSARKPRSVRSRVCDKSRSAPATATGRAALAFRAARRRGVSGPRTDRKDIEVPGSNGPTSTAQCDLPCHRTVRKLLIT
jgi:hypothetical protein